MCTLVNVNVRSPAHCARRCEPNRGAIGWDRRAPRGSVYNGRQGMCAGSDARRRRFWRAEEGVEHSEAASDRILVLAPALPRQGPAQKSSANAGHADAAQRARRGHGRSGSAVPVTPLTRRDAVTNAIVVRLVNPCAEHCVSRMHVYAHRIRHGAGFVMRSTSGHHSEQVGREHYQAKEGSEESAKSSHDGCVALQGSDRIRSGDPGVVSSTANSSRMLYPLPLCQARRRGSGLSSAVTE